MKIKVVLLLISIACFFEGVSSFPIDKETGFNLSSISLPQLDYCSPSLTNVLDSIIDGKKHIKNHQEISLVLRIGEFEGKPEFRFAFIDNTHFEFLLLGKKDIAIGWFQHKDFLVIVFGNDNIGFFSSNLNRKKFDFIRYTKLEDISEAKLSELQSVIFEPKVYIYDYDHENDKLIYIKSGKLSLLQ